MFEQPYDALHWLCEKSGHKHIYALLRSGGLFLRTDSKLFQACVSLSDLLHDEVDCVIRLIQHHDWRNQVIGNVVAVLNRDTRYEQTYLDKLTRRPVHFPSPLAAGWLMVNTGITIPNMEAFLTGMSKRSDKYQDAISYAQILAVYAALRTLDSQRVEEFEATDLFRVLSESSYYPQTVESTQHTYFAYLRLKPIV